MIYKIYNIHIIYYINLYFVRLTLKFVYINIKVYTVKVRFTFKNK